MRKFTRSEQISLFIQFLFKYRRLKNMAHLPLHEKVSFQFKKIKQLLDVAYNNTNFYKEKYDSAGIHPKDINSINDIKYLPTITKDDLINYNQYFINNKFKKDKLILTRSSGSSGKFVDLYYDAQSFINQEMQVIKMIKEFYPKYSPFDKELLVYTSEYPFTSIAGMFKVYYINNLSNSRTIFEKIKLVKPKVIAIYPSILRDIIYNFPFEYRSLGVKVIITNSEYSTQEERDFFSDVFDCKVFDEFSSEELMGIAYQCNEKKYHISYDSCYLELLEKTSNEMVKFGEIGEIVGTNLNNFAMPIIRYRQSDLAILDDKICTCGNTTHVIKSLLGRENDSFVTKTGFTISSGRLLDWTYNLVLNNILGIKEFELVQVSISKIEVKLVVNNGFILGRDDIFFIKEFEETFGRHFQINVSLVEWIDRTTTGKYNPIRSNIKQTLL